MPHDLKRPIIQRVDAQEAKIALAKKGWKLRDLAKAIDRSVPVVSQAINHGDHQPTVKLISQKLGIKLRKGGL